MTAQRPEILIYNGEAHAMCTEPLADYFGVGSDRPNFAKGSTACWRGYQGRWEVIDNRLYLIDLQGKLKDGREANVRTLFPDCPGRVLAHWFNGTVRLPQGKLLKYVHAGYGSIYERDLLIRFARGMVAEISVQINGTGWRSWLRRHAGLHRRVIFRDGEISDAEMPRGPSEVDLNLMTKPPRSEAKETARQELASPSGPSADDLAFLSRMIKQGLERQANMPTPIDADGFLVPQPPYIDPDQEAGEGR